MIPKIGDTIRFTRKDEMWSSGAGGACPNDQGLIYPYEGVIKNVYDDGRWPISIDVDGWGFDLAHIDYEIIESNVNPLIFN